MPKPAIFMTIVAGLMSCSLLTSTSINGVRSATVASGWGLVATRVSPSGPPSKALVKAPPEVPRELTARRKLPSEGSLPRTIKRDRVLAGMSQVTRVGFTVNNAS